MTNHVAVTEAPKNLTSIHALTAHRRDLSITTIALEAGIATAGGAGAAVLRALGARDVVMGQARHDLDNISLASIWLTAHRTRQLIVGGLTDAASYRHINTIAAITEAACVDLVVAADPGHLKQTLNALRTRRPSVMTWDDLPPLQPEDPDAEPPSWTAYTDGMFSSTDVFTYLATAKRLLPRPVYEDHFALYTDALERTTRWMAQHPHGAVTRSGVTQAMTTLINEQRDWDEVVTAVNGAIAALLRSGWLLSVEFDELRAALNRTPHPHWSEREWRMLRAYRDPERAACLTLYMLGLAPTDIRSLTIAEAAAFVKDPATGIRGHSVPTVAEPYIRAQTLARVSNDADPSNTLCQLGNRRIAMDVNNARAILALNLGSYPYSDSENIAHKRVTDDMFRIEALT